MTFKQLEYFAAVAQSKSISKAAVDLHVAQPPISRQLALLEDELGVCLFLRTNKGIELTEAGQVLSVQSKQVFQDLRAMVETVRDVDSGLRGCLKLGSIYSTISFALDFLKEYHAQYPLVEYYIRMGTPNDLLQDLSQGNLHVVFLRGTTNDISGIRERILSEESLEVIMTKELDPAPDLDYIPIERLKNVPMCLLRSDNLWSYNNYLINECQRNGFSPNIVCQCYDTPMALQMVQSGFGISYLPPALVRITGFTSLCSKPVQGLVAKSYPTMMWNTSIHSSGCVKRFIEMFGSETPCTGKDFGQVPFSGSDQ